MTLNDLERQDARQEAQFFRQKTVVCRLVKGRIAYYIAAVNFPEIYAVNRAE